MQVRRFGRVSALVEFPDATRRSPWPHLVVGGGTVAIAVVAGWGWGAAAVLAWGGGVAAYRARRRGLRWRAWSAGFRASLPALMAELARLPTQQRLYEAGRKVGSRVLAESLPPVPRRTVPGDPDPTSRLLWWVSAQCHAAPPAFHRGLWASRGR